MTKMISVLIGLFMAVSVAAQEAAPEPQSEAPMTLSRLAEIVLVLDPDAQTIGTRFQLTIDDIPMLIITDPVADRMRAMVPIRLAEEMTDEEMLRVMQANFDTALDARYAVANGQLWGVFIHPLSPLERAQLISGLGQTINIAKSYGSLYTGGAMTFGGGDSAQIHRDLIDELLKKGEEI